MGENLSLAENDVENKEIIFPSVLEYLSAFEQSSQFNEVLSQREKELAREINKRYETNYCRFIFSRANRHHCGSFGRRPPWVG